MANIAIFAPYFFDAKNLVTFMQYKYKKSSPIYKKSRE